MKQTPLHALHLELGARMVPFAGYEMPVQYPAGIMREHLHTRESAGLFDVSHMGQVLVRGAGASAARWSAWCPRTSSRWRRGGRSTRCSPMPRAAYSTT